MFDFVFINSFASYLIVIISVLLISTFWYFWFVYRPYVAFPTYRIEGWILLWILKRVPLNYASFHGLIKQARRYEREGVMAVWLGVPYLFVFGEDIVKKIVNEPAATDKPSIYKIVGEHSAGQGIMTSNGDMYKKQYKMAAPAFQLKALKTYITIMNENSDVMLKSLFELKGQPTDDIINIISSCAIGVISESNLGEKEKYPGEYSLMMKKVNLSTEFYSKRAWSPWLYFDFALRLFPSARKVHNCTTKVLKEIIKPRLENIKESILSRQASQQGSDSNLELYGRRVKSIAESFVEQHLQDPTITMDDVTRQISFVIEAAFDTVIHSVKYAFYLLGTHKDVQDRAFEEVMSETAGHLKYDDLERLTYLDCVIKETLRLYPVPFFGRYLRKELQSGKYKIPKNTNVLVFSYMLHRNPEIYPDPEKFNPERFMDKNSKIKRWNYVPFAEGLRSCIGKNFALIEMKIILAHVLRNFEIISLDSLEEKDLTYAIVLGCTKKLKMQFLPRKQEFHRKPSPSS